LAAEYRQTFRKAGRGGGGEGLEAEFVLNLRKQEQT